MDGLERSLPYQINYQDVLPVAVPAIARRRKFYPANGTTFSAGGTSEIRIEVGSTNALLDTHHSYIEMVLTNTSAQTFGFDIGSTDVLFREIRVEQGGRVLAREQEHNRLHAAVLSQAQVSMEGQLTDSIVGGQRGLNNGVGGQMVPLLPAATGAAFVNQRHNSSAQLGIGGVVRLTMPMPTGLFTQDKLLPLPLVAQNSPITLVLILDNPARCGVWNGAVANTALQVDRISYNAQLIEVGGDVIQQIRMMQEMGDGQLTISSTDFEHSQGLLPLGSVGETNINIPIRKRSIKSLFFQINSEDLAGAFPGTLIEDVFNLSFGGNANMDTYQLRVGSVTFPSTPVNCWGDVARVAGAARPLPIEERGECVMELAKSLGTLGFTNPTGRLSTLTYGTSTAAAIAAGFPPLTDGDNGTGAGITLATTGGTIQSVTPFGLDLESFQREAIQSGVDSETMALSTNLTLNISAIGSGIENKNVHTWLLHDRFYYFNRDGSITMSD